MRMYKGVYRSVSKTCPNVRRDCFFFSKIADLAPLAHGNDQVTEVYLQIGSVALFGFLMRLSNAMMVG